MKRRAWWAAAAGLTLGVGGSQTGSPIDPEPVVADQPATRARAARPTKEGRDLVQAQVMDFTDDFTLRLADLTDRVEPRLSSIDARIAIHRLRYTVAHGLTLIASSANPRVALIDMVVVMSLQRRLVEERLVPLHFKDMPWITSVFKNAEDQIRMAASQTLTPEQVGEIDALVNQWLEANPYRHYAAYVRLNDFAQTRQQTAQSTNGRAPSIFSLLLLDPLAGLDPTTRELEQTRLFAERAMFYLQRLPQLVSWQAELLYIDAASEPEVTQALLDVTSLANSVDRLTRDVSELRADLPALIAGEREAAIDQAAERVFEGLGAERAAMLDDLERRAATLDRTLGEFTRAFEAGDRFGRSGAELVTAIGSLTETVRSMGGQRDPDAPATTIRDYESAIVSATALVERLDGLVGDLDALAASDVWDQRRRTVDDTMRDAQARLETVLDRTYRRAFLLVGVMLAGFLAIGLVLKLVPGRRRV